MGSFEENYSKAALRMFTDQEQATLRRLHQLLDEKFDEIASFLAKQHGLANADEEAEEAIERWEKDAEMADTPPTPSGALQRLLSEHHSICEEIMDIRDGAVERDHGDLSPEDN
jgi:acyl-CoA reductase-like NAD-dependent aldehyde dehydrogenase